MVSSALTPGAIPISPGCFGENLVVDGIDFASLPADTRIKCNEVLLEISQIGKECHSHCQIHEIMGECIMPTQGVFAIVLKGGTVKNGDFLTVLTEKESNLTLKLLY